jgi:hypothetical protein
MLFWKEHKDDTKYMHGSRSRYVKMINKDEASITTKVAVKPLRDSEEMTQQMRWHKEAICDSEDANIMSDSADAEAWHTLDRFDPESARDPRTVCLGLSTDGFQPYSPDTTAYTC